MTTVLDIQKAFESTWGYIGLPYPEIIIKRFLAGEVKGKDMFREYENWKGEWKKLENRRMWRKEVSDLGIPIIYKNTQYKDLFLPVWLAEKQDYKLNTRYLLPLSMMDITCKKNIITTPLVNRNGTVKEEISRADWEINIKGMMVGEENAYPDDQVQILVDWWEQAKSLRIENAKTAICMNEGENVVITSVKFPEVKGKENVQPYEIKLVSDIEFEIELR